MELIELETILKMERQKELQITLMKGKVLVSVDDIEVTLHIKPGIRIYIAPNRPYDLNLLQKGKDWGVYYCGRFLDIYANRYPIL